jgi:hypothetical protein
VRRWPVVFSVQVILHVIQIADWINSALQSRLVTCAETLGLHTWPVLRLNRPTSGFFRFSSKSASHYKLRFH